MCSSLAPWSSLVKAPDTRYLILIITYMHVRVTNALHNAVHVFTQTFKVYTANGHWRYPGHNRLSNSRSFLRQIHHSTCSQLPENRFPLNLRNHTVWLRREVHVMQKIPISHLVLHRHSGMEFSMYGHTHTNTHTTRTYTHTRKRKTITGRAKCIPRSSPHDHGTGKQVQRYMQTCELHASYTPFQVFYYTCQRAKPGVTGYSATVTPTAMDTTQIT